MFGFIKKFFDRINIFIDFDKCKFVKSYFTECKVRPQIVNVNRNEPAFFPSSIKTSKYSGSCSNINS